MAFGQEDPASLLTKNEIAKIINSGFYAIEESVKQTQFNKRIPQLQNVYVTNKKFNYAHVYKNGTFEIEDVNNVINDLIDNHKNNLEEYMDMDNIPYKKSMFIRARELLEILDGENTLVKDKTTIRLIKELKKLLYNEKNKQIK